MNEGIPTSFKSGELSVLKLKFAAFLSAFYVLLSVPTIGISFLSGFDSDNQQFELVSNVLAFISMLIWIYLLLVFKSLLNSRFEFDQANRLIDILIGMSVLMVAISLFMNAGEEEMGAPTIIYFVLLVPFGIVTVLFGKKLLSIPAQYRGLKIFSWVNILTGVRMASVVLILMALPLGIVSGIAMCVMFFTASKELRELSIAAT